MYNVCTIYLGLIDWGLNKWIPTGTIRAQFVCLNRKRVLLELDLLSRARLERVEQGLNKSSWE